MRQSWMKTFLLFSETWQMRSFFANRRTFTSYSSSQPQKCQQSNVNMLKIQIYTISLVESRDWFSSFTCLPQQFYSFYSHPDLEVGNWQYRVPCIAITRSFTWQYRKSIYCVIPAKMELLKCMLTCYFDGNCTKSNLSKLHTQITWIEVE